MMCPSPPWEQNYHSFVLFVLAIYASITGRVYTYYISNSSAVQTMQINFTLQMSHASLSVSNAPGVCLLTSPLPAFSERDFIFSLRQSVSQSGISACVVMLKDIHLIIVHIFTMASCRSSWNYVPVRRFFAQLWPFPHFFVMLADRHKLQVKF